MVTVNGKNKKQMKRPTRRLLAVALTLSLLPLQAFADGLMLPDALLGSKKAKETKAAPVVKPTKPVAKPAAQESKPAIAKPAVKSVKPVVKPVAKPPKPAAKKPAAQKSKPAAKHITPKPTSKPSNPIPVVPSETLTPTPAPVKPPVQTPVPELEDAPAPVVTEPEPVVIPAPPVPAALEPKAKTPAVKPVKPAPGQPPIPVVPQDVAPRSESPSPALADTEIAAAEETAVAPEVTPVSAQLTVPAPNERPTDAPVDTSEVATTDAGGEDDGDGAGLREECKNCDARAAGLSGQIENGKKVAAAAKVDHNQMAARLAQSAWAAAARCRDFAEFKKVKLGLPRYKTVKGKKQRITYNSCKTFGRENAYRSKGLCAAGTREAFAEAGIKIARANAKDMDPNLRKAGFKKIKYDPKNAAAGTVLMCNGGTSDCGRTKKGGTIRCGHIEVVVKSEGKRWFCSDFCSLTPTCSKGVYNNARAYSL
ncbi:MAG: hypothetical protein KF799_12135 [Bdellovibrionales bacterium]|nr:hypothetical protein [Bdellovibrionales bacterium]